MPNRKDFLSTLIIQSAGILATLLISVVIARRLGATGQGFWAGFRAITDLIAVVGAYGFPAAFTYMINVHKNSVNSLAKFTLYYSAANIPILAAALVVSYHLGLLHLQTRDAPKELLLLALAGAMTVAHAMIRGLALPTVKTWAFNVIGILLPTSILISIAVWPLNSTADLMAAGLSGIAVAVLISTAIWLFGRKDQPTTEHATKISWRALIGQGGWNFVIAALTAALPTYTIQKLSTDGVTIEQIGCFSLAALVMGAALTPANLAGPIAYNAWSKSTDMASKLASYRTLIRWSAIGATLLSLFTAAITPYALPLLVGKGFESSVDITKILLLAVPFGYGVRLMANILMATGNVQSYAMATGIRLTTYILWMSQSSQPTIYFAAVGWVIAEVFTFLACALAMHRYLKWSWAELLGLAKGRPA